MYYSYVEIEYVAMSFSPTRTDLALKLLKLHKKYNLNHFAPMHICLRRLCLRPPDPNTVKKLRLSDICMCYYIVVSLW